jgi:hypothetical protein
MSILINAIMDHKLQHWNDAPRVIEVLEPALAQLRAVRDYWDKNLHGQNDTAGKDIDEWRKAASSGTFERTSLQGPGSFHVDIAARALAVRAGGRWSGFMTIPELRKVHLDALRAIAKCAGASLAAYFADNDNVWDFFYSRLPYEAIGEALTKTFGPPRLDVDIVDAEAARLRPTVWYYETFETPVYCQ